jgi:uncharacterized damage-inducible protein DinB
MSTTLSQSLLPEFDHEMANTRKTLERVPEGIPDFTPHPRSMTLARLAGHIADIPQWAILGLERREFDMEPLGEPAPVAAGMTSRLALLADFDRKVAAGRALLAAATDDVMLQMWTLKKGGHTILSMPRVTVLRTFVLNHVIHHRAQLGVYLRLNEIAVPSLYGPSADEM